MQNLPLTEKQIQEIRRDSEKQDWINISGSSLTEDFIREFQKQIIWIYIACYQNLSENFMREFQDKLDWSDIAYYQVLSEEFILEFFDRLVTRDLFRFQKMSKEFILYLLSNDFIPDFYKPGNNLLNFKNNPLIDPEFFEELKQMQKTFL